MSAEDESYEETSTSLKQMYIIDQDDDSDSDGEGGDQQQNAGGVTVAAEIGDVDDLRSHTKEILDMEWKNQKAIQLLTKLMDLDNPSISGKMVDFLFQDGVCEVLLDFITRLGQGERPSPQSEDNNTTLKMSFKATILITADEPSDALMSFLNKKAVTITRKIFDVFREDSAGSFYHAARVLETMLRIYPGIVYDAITADGRLAERMNGMLRYLGCVPVADIVVMLVCMSPVPKMSPGYAAAAKSRWNFLEGISSMNLLVKLAEIAVNAASHCWIGGYVCADDHSSAALQVLLELVEKFSMEDNGEIVLRAFGHNPDLLDILLNCGLGLDASKTEIHVSDEDLERSYQRRRAHIRFLCYLLKRSANNQIVVYVGNANAPPTPLMINNMLFPLRSPMLAHLKTRVADICASLIKQSNIFEKVLEACAVTYPGHKVAKPFSALRLLLVEFIVLLVEADAEVSTLLDLEIWKMLITWIFEYPHNSIYHSMMYRMIFSVLRQNNDDVLRNVIQKSRLINLLADNFLPYSDEGHAAGPGRNAPEDVVAKSALRGIITNCSNAIRLQMESLPPSSFLRTYLNGHGKWDTFLPQLKGAAMVQQNSGLGFRVPADAKALAGASASMQHLASLLAGNNPLELDEDAGIHHGSKYAKSLGFENEMAWPVEHSAEPKKKRASKKKKRSNHHRRRKSGTASSLAEGEDDEEGSGDEDEEDDEDGVATGRDSSSDRRSVGSDDASPRGSGSFSNETN